MGFHLLLEPHYFSFHSLDISTRRHQLSLPLSTTLGISNRLVFITFLTLALLPIYGVLTVESSSQKQQQTSASVDVNGQSLQCETKALDDVPPDPVSKLIKIALQGFLIKI